MRSRWTCAVVAWLLLSRYQLAVSRETVRRWLRHADLVWRRPRPVLRRQDPLREAKLQALRRLLAALPGNEAAVFEDEVDINLNPKIGGKSVFAPAPDFRFKPPTSYGPFEWITATGADRYRRALPGRARKNEQRRCRRHRPERYALAHLDIELERKAGLRGRARRCDAGIRRNLREHASHGVRNLRGRIELEKMRPAGARDLALP